ncbi:ATP-binding protein [Pyxidicoccus xibeiensis]|uniref:ATP-binding protein n=1 Tax=Pyxidicoccus xibeiensis TaxID=2906759 RepID=UPI0020A6E511|nr:ATP-binding protein [Pyxidicoccus xibeiensis]MCP3143944.1 PAS domain S-box protein [Pyxidicoccus xibeiensis]
MTPTSARAGLHSLPWPTRAFSVALLFGVCMAASVRLDTLSHSVPFPIFLAGILAAAWLGGTWLALVFTGLATTALALQFIPPRGLLVVAEPGDAVLLGTFSLVGGLISVAVASLQEARGRAEQLRRLTEALARAATPPELAAAVRQQALAMLEAPLTALWTAQGGTAPLAPRHVPASPTEPLPGDSFTTLAEHALRSGALLCPRSPGPGRPCEVAVTLRGSHQVLGALVLLLPGRASPGLRQRRLLLALGEACAVALERALLQERLLGERQMLDAVLAQAPVGVIVAEAPSSRILLYNAAAERILGHPCIPSNAVADYAAYGGLHSDGTRFSAEEYPTARALLKGEHVQNELQRYLRGDGVETLLEISAAPLRSPEGAITAAVCVFSDVAARQRAEQALRVSEERYRQMFEAAPQVIWTNATDGSNTLFNSRWFELTGQTPEQAASYGWLKVIHPEDLPRLRARRDEGIREGQAYAVEFRVKAARGGYRWLLGRVVPLRGASGALEGWLGAAIDIHERKRAEAVQRFLAEASAVLARSLDERETLEQAIRLVVPELADWCIVDLNTAAGLERVAVFHPDPAAAPHLEALRRHRHRAGASSPVLEVFRTGEPRLIERFTQEDYVATTRSDAHLAALRALAPSQVMVVPLVAREQVLGTLSLLSGAAREPYTGEDLGLARDFAARCALALENARLLNRLQRSLRTRDDFLSSVAHDLRNPLTVIKMRAALLAAEVAKRGELAPERLESAAARILKATDEMGTMIESVVDLMRGEMGQAPNLRRTDVDMVALTRDVASDQQQGSRRHEVRVHTPDAPIIAPVDPVRVRRIVRNLLTNAVKYSPEGSSIDVSVQHREEQGSGWAVVEVQDRGMGIPARDLPHLFERFFRGENVTGRIPGTGLGLFGSRALAEQHGGRIEVKSVEGQGSTFSLWLPQTAPAEASSGKEQRA